MNLTALECGKWYVFAIATRGGKESRMDTAISPAFSSRADAEAWLKENKQAAGVTAVIMKHRQSTPPGR